MVEDDSTICKADWSNLPHDLLSQIANSLGPFGYLSLSLVCKNWRNATLEASREHKCSRYNPWYLLYGGESSQCTLLSNTDNIYTIDIPELDGATCLVSYEGWLLVLHDGSLFFFCPFSKAKLELPNCPFEKLNNHIAAFSSPPTSQDCIVVVVSQTYYGLDQVHMLCRGDSIWVERNHNVLSSWHSHDLLTGVSSHKVEFIFDVTNKKQSNTFSFPKQSHKIDYPIVTSKDVRRKLGLNANVSISTCGSGTLHLFSRNKAPLVAFKSEYIDSFPRRSRFKGVWILPRYHHIPTDLSW